MPCICQLDLIQSNIISLISTRMVTNDMGAAIIQLLLQSISLGPGNIQEDKHSQESYAMREIVEWLKVHSKITGNEREWQKEQCRQCELLHRLVLVS